jgi:hypothetical protein
MLAPPTLDDAAKKRILRAKMAKQKSKSQGNFALFLVEEQASSMLMHDLFL